MASAFAAMNLEALVPVVVVLMMIIVGTEISRAELTASLRMRGALLGGTLAQWLLLPLLAALAIWLLQPPASLAGWLSGSALRLSPTDRAVLAVEFAVRNVGIAAVLALTTFRQQEFAAFGALFVLLQAPLLLAILLARNRLKA